MRLLFWLLLIFLVWMILKARSRAKSSGPGKAAPTRQVAMVACAYCHLHIPRDEAVGTDGNWYCCEEHQRLAGRR